MGNQKQQPTPISSEEARLCRRARRRRLYRLRQYLIELLILGVLVALVAVPISLIHSCNREPIAEESTQGIPPAAGMTAETWEYPRVTADTYTLTDEVDAQSAILVDVTDNVVVASKQPKQVLYPASITKVMTLLVAVENIADFTDTFVMTFDMLNTLYIEQASVAGFSAGEAVTMEDLLYGCILPSGADATWGLAEYVAGSEEDFAELMNRKAEELGLRSTHFTNTSGLHDANHYTTAEDMALIMAAAMDNPHCRQVLSTYQYTTAATPEHPEGILLTSTMFSRMYGDEAEGALIISGKTGYTTEAGHTMVSYAEGENGHDYILVTMKGSNRWKATYDAINTYTRFCAPSAVATTSSTVQY